MKYEVIGDYPNSPYKIGDIIDFTDGYTTKVLTRTSHDNEWGENVHSNNYYDSDEFDKYPNLFKKLSA